VVSHLDESGRVDAADGDQWDSSGAALFTRTLKSRNTNRLVGALFGRCFEHRSVRGIVRPLQKRASELLRGMRRGANSESWVEAANVLHGYVVLPDVDEWGARESGQIRTVIDDECHAVLPSKADQGVQRGEESCGRRVFSAKLEPTRLNLDCQLGKRNGLHAVARAHVEVHDGIEFAGFAGAEGGNGGHGLLRTYHGGIPAVMSPWHRVAPLVLGLGLVFRPESASAVAPGPEEASLLDGLTLRIREDGPLRPWVVAIENSSTEAVNIVKDPRLLAFSVTVPGKKKPVSCRLPQAMLPTTAESERLRLLEPGHELRFRIDPRFYCFDGDNGVLVPGALLEATYGFEGATRTTTRGGRKVTERLPSTPPYVAQFPPEAPVEEEVEPEEAAESGGTEDSASDADDGEGLPERAKRGHHSDGHAHAEGQRRLQDEDGREEAGPPTQAEPETAPPAPPPPHDPNRPGLRSLRGIKLALGSEYASWDPSGKDDTLTRGLVLEVVKGSDSLNARGAEVTVRITNRGYQQQRLYVRRELISYYLLGPEGLSVCAADPELRAPDGQSFTTLGAGKQIQFVTRLVEFCPGDIIDRPGFYLVGAELDAQDESNEPGINAFEGMLYTTRGKTVRIQKGELPFVHRNVPRTGLVFTHTGKLLRDNSTPAQSAEDAPQGDDTSFADDVDSVDDEDDASE
jgi:hypothetical protein